MQIDQSTQAAQFASENLAEINKAKSVILAASDTFLKDTMHVDVPIKVVAEAFTEIERGNITGFIQIIRPMASDYIKAGFSEEFWHIVDSANFFSDATGIQWRYMTTDGRHQSLLWAAEHAKSIH